MHFRFQATKTKRTFSNPNSVRKICEAEKLLHAVLYAIAFLYDCMN